MLPVIIGHMGVQSAGASNNQMGRQNFTCASRAANIRGSISHAIRPGVLDLIENKNGCESRDPKHGYYNSDLAETSIKIFKFQAPKTQDLNVYQFSN